MKMKNSQVAKIFIASFVVILLIHVISVPLFFIIVSHQIKTNTTYHQFPDAYVVSRFLRFILCLTISWFIRKRYKEKLDNSLERKHTFIFALLALLFATFLYLCGWGDDFYHFVSSIVRIYGPERAPLFLEVFFEQVFSIDLVYSALFGFLIITAPKRLKRKVS